MLLTVGFFAAVLVGCKDPTPTMGSGSADISEGGTTGPIDESDMAEGEGIKEGERFSIRDGIEYGHFNNIHFDYDSAGIRSADRSVLEEIAKWAKANNGKKIRIEGHCDERGTPEYNRTLGQRRALAAREYLVKLGVAASQLGTVSFGQEQPEDPGHNDEAWAKNRRDAFGVVK